MQPGRSGPLTPYTDPREGSSSDICPGRERGHVQLQELDQGSPGEDLLRPGTWELRLGQGPGQTCSLLTPAEPQQWLSTWRHQSPPGPWVGGLAQEALPGGPVPSMCTQGTPRGGGVQSPPQASTRSTSHLCPLATQPWTQQPPPHPNLEPHPGGRGAVERWGRRLPGAWHLTAHRRRPNARGRYQSLLCLALGGPRRPECLADSHPCTGAPAVQALSRERQRPVRPSRPLASMHPNPVPSCPPRNAPWPWLPSRPFPTSSLDAPGAEPCSPWRTGSPIAFTSTSSSPSLTLPRPPGNLGPAGTGKGREPQGQEDQKEGSAQEGRSGLPRPLASGERTSTHPDLAVSPSLLLPRLPNVLAKYHRQGQLKLYRA